VNFKQFKYFKIDFQCIIIIVEPSSFVWFKNKTGAILGTNFDDFVEKNTGIQTYIYKIRNFLFKIDPPFGCQRIQNICGFRLENRGYIRNIAGNPLDVGFTNNFSGVQRCFRYLGR
jgi:hypothetical protein